MQQFKDPQLRGGLFFMVPTVYYGLHYLWGDSYSGAKLKCCLSFMGKLKQY